MTTDTKESMMGSILSAIKVGIIYRITNRVNNKSYIGQTIGFWKRIQRHMVANELDSPLYRAINKYGWINFEIEILFSGDVSASALNDLEIEFISKYNTLVPNGYNVTMGGKGWRGIHGNMNEETKSKISAAHKGKPKPWQQGKPSGALGYHHTQETKIKIANSHKGKSKKISSLPKEKRKDNKSGYKGVSWDKSKNKWQANIGFCGKSIFLGRFESILDAARAYDAAATKYYGYFAILNFKKPIE